MPSDQQQNPEPQEPTDGAEAVSRPADEGASDEVPPTGPDAGGGASDDGASGEHRACLDADAEAERPWVATGFVPGTSLGEVVRGRGTLPPHSVRYLAEGLLKALKQIHGAEIVHRDLKPFNVLLTVEGPRVIDFGIARAMPTTRSAPCAPNSGPSAATAG